MTRIVIMPTSSSTAAWNEAVPLMNFQLLLPPRTLVPTMAGVIMHIHLLIAPTTMVEARGRAAPKLKAVGKGKANADTKAIEPGLHGMTVNNRPLLNLYGTNTALVPYFGSTTHFMTSRCGVGPF